MAEQQVERSPAAQALPERCRSRAGDARWDTEGAAPHPAARYPQPVCVSPGRRDGSAGTRGVVTRGWVSLGEAKGRSREARLYRVKGNLSCLLKLTPS